MGLGHVYRMSALAELLKKGIEIEYVFVMPDFFEGISVIESFGHPIYKIKSELKEVDSLCEANNYLKQFSPDLIIIDALKSSNERAEFFKKFCCNTVAFDDTGEGADKYDVLFNILYQHKKKLQSLVYSSPEYIFLRSEFAECNLAEKRILNKGVKIFVSQGGSDTYGIVPKIIEKLSEIKSEIIIFPIIGSSFKHFNELDIALKDCRHKVELQNNIRKISELMFDCDLAITGAGITLYELCACGVPSITVTQEYKELETSYYFEKQKAVINLGLWELLDENRFIETVSELITDAELRKQMSINSKKLVDGKGCEKIIKIIISLLNSNSALRFKKNNTV
mgnify:CR=1 FL=1